MSKTLVAEVRKLSGSEGASRAELERRVAEFEGSVNTWVSAAERRIETLETVQVDHGSRDDGKSAPLVKPESDGGDRLAGEGRRVRFDDDDVLVGPASNGPGSPAVVEKAETTEPVLPAEPSGESDDAAVVSADEGATAALANVDPEPLDSLMMSEGDAPKTRDPFDIRLVGWLVG